MHGLFDGAVYSTARSIRGRGRIVRGVEIKCQWHQLSGAKVNLAPQDWLLKINC